MDIIATRGSFGDFGRVTKGQILKDVQKSQAEKMIGSGAFRQATADDAKAADTRKKAGVVGAKAAALKSSVSQAEFDKRLQAADAAVAAANERANEQIESAKAETKAAQDALAEAVQSHADELAKVQADAAAQIAAAKNEAGRGNEGDSGAGKK